MDAIKNQLRGMSIKELRAWAGQKICDRGESYVSKVTTLKASADGTLAAIVSGTDDYITSARRLGKGNYEFQCSCPYEGFGPCKHVVAVLLAAQECLKSKGTIEEATSAGLLVSSSKRGKARRPAAGDALAEAIEQQLRTKTKQELKSLLLDLVENSSECATLLFNTLQVREGPIDDVVQSIRAAIRRVSSQEAWSNPWRGTSNIPDYGPIRQHLLELLQRGHADAVLELGMDLFHKGVKQIEHANDEGETAAEIAYCMSVVVNALPASSLSPERQLLWLIDLSLMDEYSLLPELDPLLKSKVYSKQHWRSVAKELETRLAAKPVAGEKFTRWYSRLQLLEMLVLAFGLAGQSQRTIPTLEREADSCLCYRQLAVLHCANKDYERARYWCIRGFEQTHEEMPGIASNLIDELREIAKCQKRFDLVAAYYAMEFFRKPSLEDYQELKKASVKLKVCAEVRSAALAFLENGVDPSRRVRKDSSSAWPLPEPEVRWPDEVKPRPRSHTRDLELLIEIALFEKRHHDAIQLYGSLASTPFSNLDIGVAVADAIAAKLPEDALSIWSTLVDKNIKRVSPAGYTKACEHLRKMHQVFRKSGKLNEWTALIAQIRSVHKAKRRLMQELDSLPGTKPRPR